MSACGKVGYKSRRVAILTAARMAGRHNTSKLRIYRCPNCRLLHLTSTP